MVTRHCCYCPLCGRWGFFWASRRPTLLFPANWEELRVKGQLVTARTSGNVFQCMLCALWLQPSTCHQTGIQTADAHFQIHPDALHQLNYNFLSAGSCLSCPLQNQKNVTFPSSRAMICDHLVGSDGALAPVHTGLIFLTESRRRCKIFTLFVHHGCQNVLKEYWVNLLISKEGD